MIIIIIEIKEGTADTAFSLTITRRCEPRKEETGPSSTNNNNSKKEKNVEISDTFTDRWTEKLNLFHPKRSHLDFTMKAV